MGQLLAKRIKDLLYRNSGRLWVDFKKKAPDIRSFLILINVG